MHDKCKPLRNAIVQGDTWLSKNVPVILNSTAYKSDGALFITWDEAASGDGLIGMIVLSPFAKGSRYENLIHYTHGSTLRTLEEIFGVSPLLNDAADQTDLSDLFATFP
jgi:phosphatidylinositol-3-phosphatase